MTSFIDKFADTSLVDWLPNDRQVEKQTAINMLASASPLEVAEIWVNGGSSDIAGFGGSNSHNRVKIFDALRAEVDKFICDDSAYASEKKSLAVQGVSTTVIVSTVSAAVAQTLGSMAQPYTIPISILLCLAGRIGKNAYCASRQSK